jgi:hypothetical protein
MPLDHLNNDQKFFAEKRKLSPVFPDPATQLLRLQMQREAIAARVLLALCAVFAIAAPFADHPWWMAAASAWFGFGFVVTCFVAGSRAHKRAGGKSGRPF